MHLIHYRLEETYQTTISPSSPQVPSMACIGTYRTHQPSTFLICLNIKAKWKPILLKQFCDKSGIGLPKHQCEELEVIV